MGTHFEIEPTTNILQNWKKDPRDQTLISKVGNLLQVSQMKWRCNKNSGCLIFILLLTQLGIKTLVLFGEFPSAKLKRWMGSSKFLDND